MSSKQGRKITVVGGTGTVGSANLSALLAQDIHTITAISRADSSATYPASVAVVRGSYDDEGFLVSALKDQEVLILQLGRFALGAQGTFIRAAAKAGVKYILPTEFGSDPLALELTQKLASHGKEQYRKLIEELGVGSWIAVVNNPWFDWSLGRGLWGIDIPGRKATLWDGGNTKFNTTTLQRVGESVAALLSLPEEQLVQYKNACFYISSFHITQREMLDSVLRATKTIEADWKIEIRDVVDLVAQTNEEVKKGNMMALINQFYSMHAVEGQGGDYSRKIADLKLGLREESLDEVVQRVVASVGDGQISV